LVSGINRNSATIETGDQSPVNSYVLSPAFNFHYTRILHPKFSLSVGLGLGFIPIKVLVKSYGTYQGNEDYSAALARHSYKSYTRYEFLATYHQKLTDKMELNYHLGAGLFHYGNFGYYSTGFENSTDTNLLFTQLYNVSAHSNGNYKPFISVGFGGSRKLKNADLLSLKLSYNYSFQNAFDGHFSIYDNTSTGKYFNKGNFLNVQFGYTITGSKRINAVKKFESDPQYNRKTAKKMAKKELRYIDPKSTFIHFSGGIGIGTTLVENDPNGILQKAGFESFLPRISIEKGIKNNFYWELGIHTQLFWDASKFSFDEYGSSGSGAFHAYQLSGGAVYRWILKNNYNILNIHSGLTCGFHLAKNNMDGIIGSGSGSLSGELNGNPFNFYFTEESRVKSNILASVYLGLSKDFRIVNNFYFTLNYRQQFGLIKVYESSYNYNGTNIPTTLNAKTKLNGSSKDFQVGIKLKIH
jgi:hypothetical protein